MIEFSKIMPMYAVSLWGHFCTVAKWPHIGTAYIFSQRHKVFSQRHKSFRHGIKRRAKKGSFLTWTRVRNTEFLALCGKNLMCWPPKKLLIWCRVCGSFTGRKKLTSPLDSKWAVLLLHAAPVNRTPHLKINSDVSESKFKNHFSFCLNSNFLTWFLT